MDLITSKVTLHSLPSTGMVPTMVFLEIILSLGSDSRVFQLMLDPIKVIEARREVEENFISTRAGITILVDTQILVSVSDDVS